MNETKRYYWLKLPADFFEDRAIKRLKTIENGNTCIIIYLKMLLKSLDDEGKFYYEGIEKNIIEEIALDIDEKEEDVQATVNYLVEKKLMNCTENEVELIKIQELTGSESNSTKRVRKYRALQCNADVTECNANVTRCNTEKEIEKEIDKELDKKDITEKTTITLKENDNEKPKKEKYGIYSHVLLTKTEYQNLAEEYPNAEEIIQFLDDYIEEKGYRAKSHYLSIKRWVVHAVDERSKKGKSKSHGHTHELPDYMQKMDHAIEETASDEDLQDVAELIASLGENQ